MRLIEFKFEVLIHLGRYFLFCVKYTPDKRVSREDDVNREKCSRIKGLKVIWVGERIGEIGEYRQTLM